MPSPSSDGQGDGKKRKRSNSSQEVGSNEPNADRMSDTEEQNPVDNISRAVVAQNQSSQHSRSANDVETGNEGQGHWENRGFPDLSDLESQMRELFNGDQVSELTQEMGKLGFNIQKLQADKTIHESSAGGTVLMSDDGQKGIETSQSVQNRKVVSTPSTSSINSPSNSDNSKNAKKASIGVGKHPESHLANQGLVGVPS